MNGFFRSKTFIVILTLLVILGGVPAILGAMGQGDVVRSAAVSLLSPLMRGAYAVGDALHGYSAYFTEFDRLKAENEALAAALAEAEGKLSDARLLADENEWMRAYLGIKRLHTDFTFCDANLIGREAGAYMTAFTLDRGDGAEIAREIADVTMSGDDLSEIVTLKLISNKLMKRIHKNYRNIVGFNTALIILGVSSIGAYVERSGEVGIVCGDFERGRNGECLLRYLPFDADIEVGDRILSSGLGSVYPRGLVIGEVTEVTGDAYDHTKVAVVRPTADLAGLTRVMILTGYDVYTEKPAETTETTAAD